MVLVGFKQRWCTQQTKRVLTQKGTYLGPARSRTALHSPKTIFEGSNILPLRSAPHHPQAATQLPAASETELELNKKRWEESGNSQGSVDEWRWTLNWDDITPNIIIGSCPRSPEDLDRIADEAQATAVLCLQSDVCMEAMQIDWGAIRDHGVQRNVLLVRVATRDFDHFDQAFMLPEAVKMLAALLALGRRVYVHCTAGINRASLTVVGYLTFIQGMSLQEALHVVKSKRSQAHPYVDCWKTARNHLLEGCEGQVGAKAKQLSVRRKEKGGERDELGDWVAAEDYVVGQLLKRQLGCTLSLVSSMKDLQEGTMAASLAATPPPQELDAAAAAATAPPPPGSALQVAAPGGPIPDFKRIRQHLIDERVRLREALAQLQEARREIDELRHGVCNVECELECPTDAQLASELQHAQETLDATREVMRQMWSRSSKALTGSSVASMDELPL